MSPKSSEIMGKERFQEPCLVLSFRAALLSTWPGPMKWGHCPWAEQRPQGGTPCQNLIECSWHSPGSVIIPAGICLALEKGVKFLLANTKTKDISGKHCMWERGTKQRQCWVMCFPPLLLPGLLCATQVAASAGVPQGLSLSHGWRHWRLRTALMQCVFHPSTCFFPSVCSTALW